MTFALSTKTGSSFSSVSFFTWAITPAMLLAPAITCIAPRGMAAVFLATMLVAVGGHYICTRQRLKTAHFQMDWALMAVLGALTMLGGLSYFWSIAPDDTIKKTWQMFLIFGFTGMAVPIIQKLSMADYRHIGRMMLAGGVIGTGFYLYEMHGPVSLYDMVRDGYIDHIDTKQHRPLVMITLWVFASLPFLFGRAQEPKNSQNSAKHQKISKVIWAGLAVAVTYMTYTSGSQTAQILWPALIIFIAVLVVLPARITLHLSLLGVLALSIAAPVMATNVYKHTAWAQSDRLVNTFKLRIELWNIAANRAAERPLLGWGLNTAADLPSRGERSILRPDQEVFAYLHMHNAPLHIWFELGMAGVFISCLLFVLLWKRLLNDRPAAQKTGAFAMVSVFLYTLTIWGIWQTWFMCLIAFIALILYSGVRFTQERQSAHT